MPVDFAAAQTRLAESRLRALGNAAGTLAGQPVTGTFRSQWAPADVLGLQVGATRPALDVPADDLPADWHGAALSLTEGQGVGDYVVREAHPDAGGFVTLVLERAL